MKTGVALLLSLLTMGAVPPQQITWTQTNVDPTTAQTLYTYTLTITEEGNPTPKIIGLINVLCGGTAPSSTCSAALPIPTGQSAIITGNSSTLTATDTNTKLTSPVSLPYKGDQGCIFRNNLFKVGTNTSAETRKQDMNALLAEFQKAKFKHISTKQLAGNRFLVTEQCVGFLVP